MLSVSEESWLACFEWDRQNICISNRTLVNSILACQVSFRTTCSISCCHWKMVHLEKKSNLEIVTHSLWLDEYRWCIYNILAVEEHKLVPSLTDTRSLYITLRISPETSNFFSTATKLHMNISDGKNRVLLVTEMHTLGLWMQDDEAQHWWRLLLKLRCIRHCAYELFWWRTKANYLLLV